MVAERRSAICLDRAREGLFQRCSPIQSFASLWVGFGTVGLWAALDAFAERAALPAEKCSVCRIRCILQHFGTHVQGTEREALAELEDLRHLYAHNYAGHADTEYARRPRHVLVRGVPTRLSVGARFDGEGIQLDLPQLKAYAEVARALLERFR